MSFDQLAPYYRSMEYMLAGGKLQKCRVAWLDEVCAAGNVLLAGEGPGRFLETCVRRFPSARIVCVDASSEMLRAAERRWQKAGGNPSQVEFVHAVLPCWSVPKERFDLIVTHFFLDCFPAAQLADVIEMLAASASAGANWLIADFSVPERGCQRWRARLILWLAYAFFRRVTGLSANRIVPPGEFLVRAGFSLRRRMRTEWGLLLSDLWVRGTGRKV